MIVKIESVNTVQPRMDQINVGLINDDVTKLYFLKGLIGILAYTGLNSGTLALLLKFGVFASNAFGTSGSCFLITVYSSLYHNVFSISGLVVGLLLMGYGLVEIPRSMWITSNPEIMLKWCAHRSVNISMKINSHVINLCFPSLKSPLKSSSCVLVHSVHLQMWQACRVRHAIY